MMTLFVGSRKVGFRLGNIKLRSFIRLRSKYDMGRKIIVFIYECFGEDL